MYKASHLICLYTEPVHHTEQSYWHTHVCQNMVPAQQGTHDHLQNTTRYQGSFLLKL